MGGMWKRKIEEHGFVFGIVSIFLVANIALISFKKSVHQIEKRVNFGVSFGAETMV